MTNSELQEIKQYCEKKRLITKKDVEDFVILNESDRKILIRFLMLDLSKRNILYKLNAKYYKYTKDLIRFDYRYNELDTPIKEAMEKQFPNMEACIWNTEFLSNFMNLMPNVSYTFVEVNSFYLEIVYDYLRNIFDNVLINPTEKEISYYANRFDSIIVRKLITRAPLLKPYSNVIGNNKDIKPRSSLIYKQTIEKTIVDIYVDRNRFSIYYEIDSIIFDLLKTYTVNFQKLFRYAYYRGVEKELKEYIEQDIRFDTNKGEFYD